MIVCGKLDERTETEGVQRMLIGTAAYFVICPACQKHGNVICADGTHLVCYSKYWARKGAQALSDAGKVMPDEMPELLRQIDESTIPEQNDFEPFVCVPLPDKSYDIYLLSAPPWIETSTPIESMQVSRKKSMLQ
jgi:hypothetical protein